MSLLLCRAQAARLAKFAEPREFLIMHETAEQLVVRPIVGAILGLDEEDAQRLLSATPRAHDDDTKFLNRFAQFERDLDAHVTREESDEWTVLVYGCEQAQRERMGRQLQAAERSTRGAPINRDGPMIAPEDWLREPLNQIVERTYRAINDVA